MIRKVTITANACTCELCGYKWISILPTKPGYCPNKPCRSREWDGKTIRKPPPRPDRLALPAPRRRGRPRTAIALEDEP